MKPGTRALGIAESYSSDVSTLAGAVVRGDRVVDGAGFTTCTVGGDDATDQIIGLIKGFDREDIEVVFIAGIAIAWFNLLDLRRIQSVVQKPTLSVSFEASPGLESAIQREFSGDRKTEKLERYRAQPARARVVVNDEVVFVRSVGVPNRPPEEIVEAFTPVGGRPEPVRVARLLARAGDAWQANS